MTLQLVNSKFPYIWGKFDFLFYQCIHQKELKYLAAEQPLSREALYGLLLVASIAVQSMPPSLHCYKKCRKMYNNLLDGVVIFQNKSKSLHSL